MSHDSQNFTLESSTVHVQCIIEHAVKVVAAHTGCLAAITDWVMFEASLRDIDGHSSANFFGCDLIVKRLTNVRKPWDMVRGPGMRGNTVYEMETHGGEVKTRHKVSCIIIIIIMLSKGSHGY